MEMAVLFFFSSKSSLIRFPCLHNYQRSPLFSKAAQYDPDGLSYGYRRYSFVDELQISSLIDQLQERIRRISWTPVAKLKKSATWAPSSPPRIDRFELLNIHFRLSRIFSAPDNFRLKNNQWSLRRPTILPSSRRPAILSHACDRRQEGGRNKEEEIRNSSSPFSTVPRRGITGVKRWELRTSITKIRMI